MSLIRKASKLSLIKVMALLMLALSMVVILNANWRFFYGGINEGLYLRLNIVGILAALLSSVILFLKKENRVNFILLISSLVIGLPIMDYLFGNFVMDKTREKVKIGPDIRVHHNVYHHDLGVDLYKAPQHWGEMTYELCTNNFGFKSSCDNISSEKKLDVVFIGDSFTEGVGLAYEDTFVGLFAKDNPKLKVENMGVSSYSPSIYRSKIQYYLDQGMTFDHVYVFIDVSDIHDEAIKYERLISNKVIDRTQLIEDSSHEDMTLIIAKWVKTNFPILSTVRSKLKLKMSSLDYLDHDSNRGLEFGLNPRAEWTHNTQSKAYGDKGVQFGIDTAIHHMKELYRLLNERNIKLSVGVYPWPNQLKYDTVNNLHVKIWRNFCKDKCASFIDANPVFFEYLRVNGNVKTYKDLYIYGDVHFNKVGNNIIFEEINKSVNM